MRTFILFFAAATAACQPSDPSLLTAVDWTNGNQPCSERNLSFKDNVIAYNVSDGRFELFDIKAGAAYPEDPELTLINASPAQELRLTLASQGISWPNDQQVKFLFRVRKEKLSLVGIQRPGHGRMKAPDAGQANRFDLVACRGSN